MGKKSDEVLDINYDQLADYLHTHHSVYMKVDNDVYYLTDANYEAWRAQDTSLRNAKNHFVDCSELVATVDEFLMLGFINGKTIKDIFSSATFYPSLKGSKDKQSELFYSIKIKCYSYCKRLMNVLTRKPINCCFLQLIGLFCSSVNKRVQILGIYT